MGIRHNFSLAASGKVDAGDTTKVRPTVWDEDHVVSDTVVITNLNADLWDGYQFADYLNQALLTTSNPIFASAFLTDGINVGSGVFAVDSFGVIAVSGTMDSNSWIQATNFVSTVATGTRPFLCTSTTLNTNLNADMCDSQHLGITNSPQFANLIITANGDIRPSADSTTALNIAQADGTDFVIFDTTNKKIGLNNTPTANVELHAGSPSGTGNTTDLLYGAIRGTGVVRAAAFLAQKNNTASDSNTTFALNALAYQPGTANLTSASLGLVGGRYAAIKSGSGGTITSARAVTAFVSFNNSITGTITNATDYYGEAINANDGIVVNGYNFYGQAHVVDTGTFNNAYSAWYENQTVGNTRNMGIVLNGDITAGSLLTMGSAIVFGGGQDVAFGYDGANTLLMNLVGTGVFDLQMDLSLTAQNIITDTTTGLKIGTATTQKLGFFNATPIAQPSAYTQTYSTADKTHANFTSADIGAFTGGLIGFLDAAERDNVRTQFNALKADVADLKQLVNSIVDDLQNLGLFS